ncbi:RagB/SusD family nutrient uptake outer membrane protein [Algoriphagus sp. AGSA1]|uniref:RagB/SusD family nutrient uptake outer membrane protein n=1 Tax=Algoriphagus sp. AGSA1 TaxID=2907213 RepID=UPI001F3B81DD|nr:RagB/SusD family nutrient uptake outer membrane protein [Algoriphagus sp. AGSA1]MCE7056815.1 RagB/SusD family nutrient uptake outer membrane protein [Algoriphagus sp. AGSA1]
MNIRNTILFFSLIMLGACDGFLDQKPQSNLLIPQKAVELEQLLDATLLGINSTPGILELSSDNLYITEDGFLGLTLFERNAYTWQEDIYEFLGSDWSVPYQQILAANVVLEQADEIVPETSDDAELLIELRGRALWMRAQAYFQLLSAFAAPYSPGSANDSPGVPLRLSPNVSTFVDRGTIGEDYDQITGDLELAIGLLPEYAEYKTRPSKISSHALLARIYLAMEEYEKAGFHAGKVLEINNTLLDYSELDLAARYPFPLFNDEVIHHLEMMNYRHMNSGLTFVDSTLVGMFGDNDLRKELLFTPDEQGISFDGNYSGSRVRFSGLATNEMYLISAECAARRGGIGESMEILNTLLETRWVEGGFIPYTASNSEEALRLILMERRKELIFRGIRWTDLRRLNKDQRFATLVTRKIGSESFEISPGSPRYVLPIPPEEIQVSGIAQNPR